MKKLVGILMVMLLSVTLVACGGVDKQPAIDAFNNATSVYDALVNEINADISAYPQELIDVMMEMSEALLENKAILEGDQELTQEQIDAMVAAFGDVEKWAKETSSELANLKNVAVEESEPTEAPVATEAPEPTEAPKATEAPEPTEAPVATEVPEPTETPESVADNRQPAIDAFNKAVTAYDGLVDKINANPEIYPNYVVELMATMEAPLTNCKAILESNTALADENVQELVSAMNDVYAWVVEVEMSTGGSVEGAGSADLQSLIDMYNMLVEPINAYVDEVNRHVDDFDETLVTTLSEYAQFLSDCQLVFDSGLEIPEEDCKSMKYNFDIIWQWVLEVEHDIFG